MGIEVRQLLVKGTFVQRQDSAESARAPQHEAPATAEAVDGDDLLEESRRRWAEERRQSRER